MKVRTLLADKDRTFASREEQEDALEVLSFGIGGEELVLKASFLLEQMDVDLLANFVDQMPVAKMISMSYHASPSETPKIYTVLEANPRFQAARQRPSSGERKRYRRLTEKPA